MNPSYSHFESYVDGLEPKEFEEFISDLWEDFGYDTKVTKQSNDRGKDVIAQRSHPVDETVYIQAKCYSKSNKVGSEAIQKYAGLYQQGADQVVVITTSDFTKPARELAHEINVELKGRRELYDLVKEAGVELDIESKSEESSSYSTTSQTRTHDRSNTSIEIEPETAYRQFQSQSTTVKERDFDKSDLFIMDCCPNCNRNINYFHRFSPYTFSGEGSSRDRYFELVSRISDKKLKVQRIYGFPCCGALYHFRDGDMTKIVQSNPVSVDQNHISGKVIPTFENNIRIEMDPVSGYENLKRKSKTIDKYNFDKMNPLILDECPNCGSSSECFHRFYPFRFRNGRLSRDSNFELTPPDSDEVVKLSQIYGFSCCGAIYTYKDDDLIKILEINKNNKSDNSCSNEIDSKSKKIRLKQKIKNIYGKLFNVG